MYEGDTQSQIDLRLFRVWHKAHRALTDNVRKDMESHGISSEHFMILELLYSKGPHPIQKICGLSAIPSGSITYVVDNLEKSGLVKRQPGLTDRRTSIVALTDKGHTLFNEIFPKHVDMISRNLSFASNEEKLQLTEILKRIGLGAESLLQEKSSSSN